MICPRCKRRHSPRMDAHGVTSSVCARCAGKAAAAEDAGGSAASSEAAPDSKPGRKKKEAADA
jgi:hypothetical protein